MTYYYCSGCGRYFNEPYKDGIYKDDGIYECPYCSSIRIQKFGTNEDERKEDKCKVCS